MPTDTTPTLSNETLEETEHPQPETGTTTSENGGTPTTETQTPLSLDELRAQVQRLEAAQKRTNADATKHRMRNTELEKSNAELVKFKEQVEAEKLSEQQRQELARQNLEKQLAEQQVKLTEAERLTQERIIGYEVRLQAASLGVKPNLLDKVTRLLDWSEIEYADDGSPKNVKDLLGTLLKEMPELVPQQGKATSATAGGATNPRSSSSTAVPDNLTWEFIEKIQADPKAYGALSRAQQLHISQWMNNPKNFMKRH